MIFFIKKLSSVSENFRFDMAAESTGEKLHLYAARGVRAISPRSVHNQYLQEVVICHRSTDGEWIVQRKRMMKRLIYELRHIHSFSHCPLFFLSGVFYFLQLHKAFLQTKNSPLTLIINKSS